MYVTETAKNAMILQDLKPKGRTAPALWRHRFLKGKAIREFAALLTGLAAAIVVFLTAAILAGLIAFVLAGLFAFLGVGGL